MKNNYLQPSFSQERIWILSQLYSGPTYNVPVILKCTGYFDVSAFQQALNLLTARHEILRTVFNVIDEKPQQVILENMEVDLIVKDLSNLIDLERNAEIQLLLSEVVAHEFDLTNGPLHKSEVLRLSNDEHIFVVNFHHIIIDEWSIGVFFRELKELYESQTEGRKSKLKELPIQYADYAVWQREWLQGDLLDELVGYWTKQLEGLQGLELPTDKQRPTVQTFKGLTYTTKIDASLTARLKTFSKTSRVTLNMLLLAVFNVLLYRYTQQEDIAVGMPITNRNRVELEELIGFFVNTVIVRVDLSGKPTFQELLKRVNETYLAVCEHQDLPFEKLVEVINPERDLGRTPLFQVMFVMEDTLVGVANMGEMIIEPLSVETRTSKFDLTLFIANVDDQLEVVFEYSTDLFNGDRIERMAGHFRRLLEEIMNNPKMKISELELLTEAEKHQVLVEWNNNTSDYPKDKCIHQLFEEQVERTPDSVAVVFGEEQLTYRELNERANQLGHYLQKLGVGPGVLVAICMRRSLEMVIGLLGILKAGGAYVPLDPGYPKERLKFMLEDTQVPVLLAQSSLELETTSANARILYLDKEWVDIGKENTNNTISSVTPEHLMYIIYTSGSTGKPKGAGVFHHGFINLVNWYKNEFNLTERDRTLLISSFSFDLTQKNIFCPICVGGQLHILNSDNFDPELILKNIYNKNITWINCTPSAFYPLVNFSEQSKQAKNKLRYVFLGGEPIVLSRIKSWTENANPHIVNTYGPTECTDVSSFYNINIAEQLDKTIPIGKPISNVKLYVLDKNLQPLPIGIVGELYIGGVGVGDGYLNRPDVNLTKFPTISLVNYKKEKVYSTGDLVRLQPDGNIEFIGRADTQVKLLGYRIELGEIESLLRSHPQIQDAVVLIQRGESDILVSYIVADEAVDEVEVQEFLTNKLPSYMIPNIIMKMKSLPLSPSGKVDIKALPVLSDLRPNPMAFFIAPHHEDEITIANIWSNLLGINSIGIRDNFFNIGGHSLSVISAIYKMAEAGINISVAQFYKNPTIEKILQIVQNNKFEKNNTFRKDAKKYDGTFPLLPVQKNFYKIFNNTNDRNMFVIAAKLPALQRINYDLLQTTIDLLISRHESLRSRFIVVDNDCRQYISETEENLVLFRENASQIHANLQNAYIENTASKISKQLDIFNGPIFKAGLISFKSEDVILIVINHFFCDGFSMDILMEDLINAYSQLISNRDANLPSRWSSIKDWHEAVNDFSTSDAFAKEMDYWQSTPINEFNTLPSDLNEVKGGRGNASIVTSLDQMETLSMLQGKSISDIRAYLLTSLVSSYSKWMAGSKYLINITGNGRKPFFDHLDISRTVGYFATPTAVIVDYDLNKNFMDNFESTKNKITIAPHEIIFFLGLHGANEKAREYFQQIQIKNQTSFNNLIILHKKVAEFNDLFGAHESVNINNSPIAPLVRRIRLISYTLDEKIEFDWSYDNSYFSAETIGAIVNTFMNNIKPLS